MLDSVKPQSQRCLMQLQYWPKPDNTRTACMHAKTSCKSLLYAKSMSLCEVKKKKKKSTEKH